MKKGFTMIELIFVIVILGILAAVAIPKLNATRDDAEVSKAATNISTIMGDFGSYYTAQGQFPSDIKGVTNVPLSSGGVMNVKSKPCLTFTLNGSKVTVTSSANTARDTVCTNVLKMPNVQAVLSYNHVCTAKTGEGTPQEAVKGCGAKGDLVTKSITGADAAETVEFDFAASGVKFN